MVKVPIIKKRTKVFKSVTVVGFRYAHLMTPSPLQAPPVGPLQGLEGGMAETEGY